MIRNIILILILLAGLLFLLDKNFPNALEDQDNYLRIVQLLMILPIVVLAVVSRRLRLRVVIQHTVVWLAVALVLVSGYSYRFALKDYYEKIIGNIIPSMAIQQTDGSVVVRMQSDGHFHIQADVSGNRIMFLLDTGATRVALSQKDARNIGIDVDNLNYDVRIITANGVSLFARTIIPEIKIGSIIVEQVTAYVGKNGLDTSLLGMSFLSRLKEYEVTQDTLTLRK